MDRKIKYEKPVGVPLGAVAPITGATDCRNGTRPSGSCVGGSDPQLAPVCQPGLTATYNCTVGSTVTNGNCSNGGTANGACDPSGSTPRVARVRY
jgi:hypothetical protein